MAAAKRKGVPDAVASSAQRLNVRLAPEDYKRLGVHAVMMGVSPGTLVGRLIREHLREYRVQVNPPAGSDRPVLAAESSPVACAAAG
jgi:hypothetical protein